MIRLYYQEHYPKLLSNLPVFPQKSVFGNHSSQNFIDKRREQLDQYFHLLCQVENMSTNRYIWTYMGLSRFSKANVLVTNADTLIGRCTIQALTTHSSAPYLIHATVHSSGLSGLS